MQNNHYTALEPCHHWAYIALLNLRVRRTQSLFAAFMFVFQRRTTPSSQVVSSWTSTSSSGFPGGSLGPWNKLARIVYV